MLEKADHIMATYVDAADEFGRSAKEFLQHVDLLDQAWNAYNQAMAASAELRAVLDTRDENLRILMGQLEQAVSNPFGKPVPSEKKLGVLKADVMKASAASVGAASTSNVKMLP
jgi:exonuclease VII small subunit